MSSFDVKRHIRERRLKEAAEQLRGKQQFSAPPSVFRQSQHQSARSSVIEFGDAASVHSHSETGADWYQDEISSQEKKQKHFLFFHSAEPRQPYAYTYTHVRIEDGLSVWSVKTLKINGRKREHVRK